MKKIMTAVLSMALVITLCFGVVGCSPKTTDKHDIDDEQQKAQELLDYKTNAKTPIDKIFIKATASTLYDPHMADYLREIMERGKAEIDAAEDKDTIDTVSGSVTREISDKNYEYYMMKHRDVIHFAGGYCKITGEYEDIRYAIELDEYWNGLSGASVGGTCWKITSNSEDIEVNCIIDGEAHWEGLFKTGTREYLPISEEEKTDITIKPGLSIFPRYDWHKDIVTPNEPVTVITPENVYYYFIIKYKGEIIGYTVVDLDKDCVARSVGFAKEDAENMTKERVRGYIEDTKKEINGEQRDGLVTVNNTVSLYYDLHFGGRYQEGQDQRIKTSDGVSDVILTMPEDLENVEFIMHTDGAFIVNGEENKRIEITLGEDVVYENKTGGDECVYALIKRDGEMIGYALFMYRKDLSVFNFVNFKMFGILDRFGRLSAYDDFEINESFLRSFINEEIRQWRGKNA